MKKFHGTISNTTNNNTNISSLEEKLNVVSRSYQCAVRKSDIALLTFLQRNDCRDILASTMDGDVKANAFVRAAHRNRLDILELFLDQGMNVNIKDEQSTFALMLATCDDYGGTVRLLLEHNADVDLQNRDGCTALMYACEYGRIKPVELLLEKNANPDLQRVCTFKWGMTALIFASYYGRKEIVQMLLNHGADKELTDREGTTAADLAKTEEIRDMIVNHVSANYLLK